MEKFVTVGHLHIQEIDSTAARTGSPLVVVDEESICVSGIVVFWYSEKTQRLVIERNLSNGGSVYFYDPDRTLYRKLCADLGVEPVGVEA